MLSSNPNKQSSFYVPDDEDEDNDVDLKQKPTNAGSSQNSAKDLVVSEEMNESLHPSAGSQEISPMDLDEDDAFDDNIDPIDFIDCGIVGSGKYATVKRVYYKNDPSKLYAMKIIRKNQLTIVDRYRAKSERTILSTIRYPFIVKLYNAFQTQENLILVMEYGHGGDLRCALDAEPKVPVFDAKLLISEISMAIEYIHSLKVCFRDLKPANVILDKDGCAKLTDFGMCKLRNEKTRAFSTCGTIKYMSPQAIKRSDFHNPGDWWSVGVISYELLMGHHPFSNVFPGYTQKMIISGTFSVTLDPKIPEQNFLSQILQIEQDGRLCSRDGVIEIFAHPFFAEIDPSDVLSRKYTHTYNPNLDKFSYLNPNAIYTPVNLGTSYSAKMKKEDELDLHSSQNFIGYDFNSKSSPASSSKELIQFIENPSIIDTIPFKVSDYRNDYTPLSLVAKGRFSSVYKAYNRQYSYNVALKLVMKSHKDCMDEVRILIKHGSHPNLVSIRDVYMSENHMVIALEYISGPDLRAHLLGLNTITEKYAADVLRVLNNAVSYLHDNNIIHRDIRLDNIKFCDPTGKPSSLKLIDLSFAIILTGPSFICNAPCTSVNHVAPEILTGTDYSFPCDVWSMGIVLLTMLSGSNPFDFDVHVNKKQVLESITQHQFNFHTGIWKSYSPSVKDLFQCMLSKNPGERINCSRISRHPWIMTCDFPSANTPVSVDYSTLRDHPVVMFDDNESLHECYTVEEGTLIMNRETLSPSFELL